MYTCSLQNTKKTETELDGWEWTKVSGVYRNDLTPTPMTFEQQRFEMHRSTYMGIFFNIIEM